MFRAPFTVSVDVPIPGSFPLGRSSRRTALSAIGSTIQTDTIASSTLHLSASVASWRRFARFRPDLLLLAELNSIDGPDDFFPLGVVPRDWLAVRTMGTANIDGEFADIYAVEWMSYLRSSLAVEALGLGIRDIDLSTLLMAEPRRITQLASREAYRMSAAGIFYSSRYGQSLENWAVFEPVSLRDEESSIVATDDPDLREALSLHAIELEAAPRSR
jgi:hypothetical protein